ncbi:MAG TPA: 3-keto-5-aminohexanoate cleavage protein [Bacillota bacterium]
MDKLIITCALTGAEIAKADFPPLPCSPEEIAAAADEVRRAGASMVHIHGRDDNDRPTQRTDVFAKAIGLIRARTDVIVQVSTGGAVWMTAEERLGPVSLTGPLKPEMATLTTGTVNFGDEVFANPGPTIEIFARRIVEAGIKPEIEVFDAGFVDNALRLVARGLLTPPLHFDLVMGVPGGIAGTPRNLIHLVGGLPAGSTWSVAGIGRAQLPLGVMAIILGGHVRVGFEDNIFYTRGVTAQSNAQLVARIVLIAGELGREVATPDEARMILGLKA